MTLLKIQLIPYLLKKDGWQLVAEERGYDTDTMTEEEWDILYETTDEAEYYWYNIELVDESDQEQLEEWKEYDLVYQPKE